MKKKNVLVVTHDAGGSEIIAAYVKAHRAKKVFRVYTNGPGEKIFRRLGIPFHRINDERSIRGIVEKNQDCRVALLALPGWMTKIELTALQECKRAGLRTAVYLEDWRRYKERFEYPLKGWEKNLPDELWAGDTYAEEIAREQFKSLPVKLRFVRNEYFRNVITSVGSYQKQKKISPAYVLFLSSPLPDVEHVLKDLMHLLCEKFPTVPLLLRTHPADARTKFDSLIHSFKGKLTVVKSKDQDISLDLARAKIVVGTKTVALVLAPQCGIPVIRIAPEGYPPLPGVRSESSVREASSFIDRILHEK